MKFKYEFLNNLQINFVHFLIPHLDQFNVTISALTPFNLILILYRVFEAYLTRNICNDLFESILEDLKMYWVHLKSS